MANMIIEIWTKEKYSKNEELDLTGRFSHAGVKPAFAKISRLYRIDGDFEKKDFKKIAEEILIDPITEKYSLTSRSCATMKVKGKNLFRVEIWPKDSATDVVGESVKETIADVIHKKSRNVRYGHAYYFSFNRERSREDGSGRKLKHAVSKTLINELIHTFHIVEC